MSVIIVTPPHDDAQLQKVAVARNRRPSSCKVSRFSDSSFEGSGEEELLLKNSHSFCEPPLWRRAYRSAVTVRPINSTHQYATRFHSGSAVNKIGKASAKRAKFQSRSQQKMLSPGPFTGTACNSGTTNSNFVGTHPSYASVASFEPQRSFDSACSEVPQLRRTSSSSSTSGQPVRFSYSAENLHPDGPPYATRALSPRQRHRRIAWDSVDGTVLKDISGITTDYMRVNGAIHQFRTLLGSVRDKSPSHLLGNGTFAKKEDELVAVKTEVPKYPSESPVRTNSANDIHHANPSTEPTTADPNGNMSQSRLKLNISYRLGRRREIFDKRRKAADYGLVFALLGLFMMILENELTGAGLYEKNSIYSFALKTLIVISTVALLCFIVSYHTLEVQLFLIDNSADDWRIVLTPRRIFQLCIELSVCMICPIPGDYTFQWATVHADGSTITKPQVSVDVLLSIPMFMRLYLIARVMLLHSRLFTDASSRSIGALNRINFNTRFVMKTLMTLSPGTVLIVMIASFWIIAAWILRLCERHHSIQLNGENNTEAAKHENYLNSIWLVAITFLSVGYGDIVPNTICGRTVAVITGIMGAGTSSLVVAVLAKKLEFSRAEKHVHNFMMDTQLTKRLKHAAANVLRETWLIYKNRKKVEKIDSAKVRYHQRKFLMAIYELRKVKGGQRKLAENSHTVADIARTSTTTYEMVADMHSWSDNMESRLGRLEEQVDSINAQVHLLPDLIAQRLQRKSPSPSSTLKPPGSDS